MRPELELIDGQAWATSMDVADKFEKVHRNVMRDIATMVDESKIDAFNVLKSEHIKAYDLTDLKEFYRRNFTPISYYDSRGREQKGYRMTRDGFTMLVFGFEGILARIWKMRYIERFNAMENHIRRKEYRERILNDMQISEIVRVAMGQARAEMTVSFAMSLMIAKGLHLPPITRDQMIKLIQTGVIEGFFEKRQWHVYQDSFAAWLDRRRKS